MYRFFYVYYVHTKHLLTPISIVFPLLSLDVLCPVSRTIFLVCFFEIFVPDPQLS